MYLNFMQLNRIAAIFLHEINIHMLFNLTVNVSFNVFVTLCVTDSDKYYSAVYFSL